MRARDFWLNKINYLRFSFFPKSSPPPTTNQVVGGSNPSGRANQYAKARSAHADRAFSFHVGPGNACDDLDLEVEPREPVDSDRRPVRVGRFGKNLALDSHDRTELVFGIGMKRRHVDDISLADGEVSW